MIFPIGKYVFLISGIVIFTHDLTYAKAFKTVKFSTLDGTEIVAYLMKPEGKGPFPAIVALHGCSGALNRRGNKLSSRHRDWGKRFVRWGYVVLFPDSFTSRGYESLCKVRRRPVRHKHRKRDALAAQDWLAQQPYVVGNDITLLGWSNGAGTALRLAYSGKSKVFRQIIAFYPGCSSLNRRNRLQLRNRLTILMGRADDWTPPEPCQDLIEKWGGRIILYDNAYHSFDTPNRPLRKRYGRAYSKYGDGIVHTGTNERARRAAIKHVRRLLGR